MARANSNFRVANIFIFALLITLCASICLLGVFSIPHNEHKAEATLQNPAVDFLPAPEFFGFEPAPGKTGTYYALGLRSSVSEEFSELFNYRVHSIPFVENGNTINKNYGVYQAYYSANAVQHIVKSFEFRKYYFVSVESDEENPPEPYYADVTTTDFDVIYSDDPPFNNPSRPDPNSPDDYEPEDVKISSSQVEGVRWDGSTYNGALKGIDAAGTYRIKQLSVTYGGQTYSAPNDMHLIIVLKARLTVGSSAFAPLFTSDNRIQFGLNTQARTYGEHSNFRDVIGVSNATKEDGKFYFSAGNDKYFFLTSFGKNRNGVSVDSPTVLTNLDYVKDYLKVKWYDYQIVASRPIRESIDDGQPIDSAGQYSISLDWTVEFDYYADYIHTYMQGGIEKTAELTTVVEVVYGTSNDYQDFYKEFTVEKRSLNFSEDRSETGGFNGGIAVTREIEFSGNPLSASGLFSNSKISTKEMWLALNGVESDYDNTAVYDGYTFADYINNFSIVSFVGSHFNDASIGENKIVFLYMELLASNSQGVDELLKNYKAQFGYYINGTYTPFNPKSPTEQEFYQLATIENELGEIIFDGNFKILPNKITLNFSKETNYVYAQKGSQNDFNFAVDPIVSTFGKIVTNNWEVKIVTGSAGSAAVRDPVQNRIYIGIMVGRRNNDTADPVYIDGNGNKYTSYDSRARLYAGEYYFYYTVYVIHASTSSSYEGSVLPATDRAGFFDVKDRSGTVICELDLSQLQQLLITPFRFTVRVESMINEKDYDGTTDLLSFEAVLLDSQGNVSSIGSVYAPDELMVTTSLSASYSHPMAGENNPIVREFKLIKKEETATAENILRSYEIVPGEISGEWYENGIIHRLPLTINVVDYAETVRIDGKDYPLYRRNYNEVDYVIIQIAKAGDTLPDGFVAMEDYYYFYNPDDSNNGIVTASQLALERNLGVAAEKCIIITMDGFLEDEGILWDHSGVVNPINPPNIKNIFSWFDSVKGKRIEQNTDSSADDNDYYRIEFNDEEALNTLFYNYSIVLHQQCPQYSYLHIGKLELEPNFLFVQKSERYTYSGLSQKEYTVTCEGDAKAIFNFSGHHEADAIIAKLLSDGKTFADLVEVLEFSRDCDQTCPHGHYNVQDELIRNMVLAGTYSLEFTLPASTNYKGGTVYGTLRIEPKEVQAIITFAIRSYLELNPVYHTDYDEILYVNTDNELDIYSYWIKIGEEGISYEVIAYPKLIGDKISYYLVGSNEEITPIELQNIYNATKVYIDFRPITMNGQSDFDYHKEQSEDVHGLKTIYYKDGDDYIATDAYVNGVSSYYMFNEYTMNNTVIYRGFLVDGGQESFLPTELPHQVYFSVNQGNDRAYTNGLDGGVKAMGAFKHNFEFVTAEQKFYILKKALSIDVGENYNQTGVYSGNELTPMYTLVGGPANAGGVRVNIHAYTYDDQTQTYEYIIDGLPIEQIPFGFGLDMKLMDAGIYTLRLYASPSAEFMINYAAKREATVITFEVLPLEIVFIGQDESIPYSNSEYQIGGFDDYFSGQNSNWGSVEIFQILKGQEVVDKIIASGVYHVTILGTLDEDFHKNLYFDDGYGGYVYDKYFSYNVTITASASYQFKLTNDLGGVDLEDGSGFQFTYNGKSYSPTYMFINLEEDTDLLPVSWTVTNSFNNDDPIKNADTYVLTFEINATSHPEHNSNYASYEGENAQVFYVIINKAVLNVTLGFEEGYSPKKTYLDDNSVIEDHIYFIYTGWVDGEDGSEPINKITNEPIIDWEFNDGDKTIVIDKYTPAGLYGIRAKAGEDTTVLQNYYFSYSGSDIAFEIEKANPSLIVYGIYDEENDEYLPYYIYQGQALEPKIKRKYGNNIIDDNDEHLGSDGIRITFEGRFIGTDIYNITENDIAPAGKDCIDVGKYVFTVEVEASSNYNALPPSYFFMEVKPAKLDIIVQGEYQGQERGFASMIYNRTTDYPTFTVKYSGFVGRDALPSEYRNPFEIYSYNLRLNTTQIEGLGLTHPTYKIYDSLEASQDILPYDSRAYFIRLYIDEIYGISNNYYINPVYLEQDGELLLPVLLIDKRVIDIKAENSIMKTYDGTTSLIIDSVTKDHYSFIAKQGVEESGVIAGDEDYINLFIDYGMSYYERKDVYDSNGSRTEIKVRIYGFDIDNENYRLDITNLLLDQDDNAYFYLRGIINPARAKVIFLNEQGEVADPRTSVVYDSKPHYLTPVVEGVNNEVLEIGVGFNLIFESNNYSDTKAPSEAGEYRVVVTIIDTNYRNDIFTHVLVIEKAPVLIKFNGDATPFYADNRMGLTAYAYSEVVEDYRQDLIVKYYDNQGNLIVDIVKANVGSYIAYAEHFETTNFKYMEGETDFIIIPREIYSLNADDVKTYQYTGEPIKPQFWFEFNNITYYPNLYFDTIIENSSGKKQYMPYNYGQGTAVTAPITAGNYRAKAAPDFGNFRILSNDTLEYEIIPIDLVIGIKDIKVKENEKIAFSFTLTGNVAGDTLDSLDTKPTVRYFDNDGTELSNAPTKAGIYKVLPTGASSTNYNISYTFGMLTINKAILTYSAPSGGTNVTLEGNFSSDTSIVVKEITNVEYTPYKTMFETFKINNPEYSNFQLSTIYHIQFSSGTVELVDDSKIRVKLLLSEVLKNKLVKAENMSYGDIADIKAASEPKYYVAHFKSDGTIDPVEARREGEYLVFETTSLDAFSIIIEDANQSKENMWILYVSIAVGIMFIAVALLIIKKRA